MSGLADQFAADAASLPSDTSPRSLSQQFALDAQPTPPKPVEPSSKVDRFLTGLADLPNKGAQLLTHSLPDSVVQAGNKFNNFLADNTKLVARIPEGGIDQMVNEREQQYQAQRQAAGSTGFDWMRLSGNVANPGNYVIPGGGASMAGRIGFGALQGGAGAVLSTPTVGDDQKDFWQSQAKLGASGAILGGVLSGAANLAAPYIQKGYQAIKSLVTPSAEASRAAAQITQDAFQSKGINPQTVDPGILSEFQNQVKTAVSAGAAPDARTVANVAEAAALPVPVPLLRGQASRDPMQFAQEQNLRGINGIGEPITDVLQRQNRALIDNLDAMGAKGSANVVDAGQSAINAIKSIDNQARQSVTAAYDAYRQSAGKALDVPLQGVAQDFARVTSEFGDTIPSGVRNQFNELGLMSGTQRKVFTIDDAEHLLKVINKNYDPANRPAAKALDELRQSVQGAIANGAGSDAAGAEAAQLAQQARKMAAARFNMIDNVPAYKAAISDVAPDKFLQKYFWSGNAADIGNLRNMIGSADPQALATIKSSIMGDIKQTALNGQSAENGIFSQAKYNGIVRDQNNIKRLGAMFNPDEVAAMQRLGNVAENVLLAPKASAVNTSNTAGAAANLIQSAAKGGAGTKALSLLGKANIPVVSPLAAGGANMGKTRALSSMVGRSIQPLSAADLQQLNDLMAHSGMLGGLVAGQAENSR